MQGVERLSIVSKVLFDSRLIELRRENEALKLEQKRTIDAVKLEQTHNRRAQGQSLLAEARPFASTGALGLGK
jgi:hypothetical protein